MGNYLGFYSTAGFGLRLRGLWGHRPPRGSTRTQVLMSRDAVLQVVIL